MEVYRFEKRSLIGEQHLIKTSQKIDLQNPIQNPIQNLGQNLGQKMGSKFLSIFVSIFESKFLVEKMVKKWVKKWGRKNGRKMVKNGVSKKCVRGGGLEKGVFLYTFCLLILG